MVPVWPGLRGSPREGRQTGQRQGRGGYARTQADPGHPFGYGQERYFWSLLAAFGIFIAGAGFSVFEGLLALRHGSSEKPLIAYVALAAAGLAEGTSLVRVLAQLRGEARHSNLAFLEYARSSPDTTVKAALFEDSAAVVGLALAASGLGLRQLTGSPVWDGAASIAISGGQAGLRRAARADVLVDPEYAAR